jgi:hypothetical protein
MFSPLKATCLQIHGNFHEKFKNLFKSKIFRSEQKGDLHIAKSTCNPYKLTKSGQNMQEIIVLIVLIYAVKSMLIKLLNMSLITQVT